MSSTRLLVLGTVRIFQPVHGYFVRRELLSWRADHWASVNPGSIYSALRTLTRDGFLEELEPESQASRPARTSYRLTDDGETEFFVLLREAMWRESPTDPSELMAALCFMWALSREEVIAALEHRIAHLDAAHRGLPFAIDGLLQQPDKSRHIAELFMLSDARQHGEREWAAACLERVRGGEYVFAGEPWPEDTHGPEPPRRSAGMSNPT